MKMIGSSRETNLKPREALIETIALEDDVEKLSNFNGRNCLCDLQMNLFEFF